MSGRGDPSRLFSSIDHVVLVMDDGEALTFDDILPDPESVGPPPPGGEPRDPHRKFDWWRAMMRAPVYIVPRRSGRPLSVGDLIRPGNAAGEPITCGRCGSVFGREARGRRPRYCPACRVASRNKTAPRNAHA
jgi:hypothetical protein